MRAFGLIILVNLIAAAPSWADDRTDRVDQLFRAYDQANVPGASVLIVKDGDVLYERGYGLADVENDTAAGPETNYRLASVSKAFTAMAIVMLVEDGVIDYDDRLTDLISDFPSYGRNIKLKHLLWHTSGLRNYENHIPSGTTRQLLDEDVVEILKRRSSTYFTPGSSYRYSNSGYATLAHIVALKSGQRFSTFLQQRIFEPLGMANTVAFENGVNTVPHRAYGYTRRGSSFQRTDQSLTSAVLGDGGVYTSAKDYYLWDQFLSSDGSNLIGSDSLNRIFTSGRLNNGATTGYGFGWSIGSYRGRRRVSHTGSTIGFRTAVQRYPDHNFTVLVLVNRAGSSPWSIAEDIADIYF